MPLNGWVIFICTLVGQFFMPVDTWTVYSALCLFVGMFQISFFYGFLPL